MPNLNNGDGNYGECPDENFSKNKHGLYRWNRRITPPHSMNTQRKRIDLHFPNE